MHGGTHSSLVVSLTVGYTSISAAVSSMAAALASNQPLPAALVHRLKAPVNNIQTDYVYISRRSPHAIHWAAPTLHASRMRRSLRPSPAAPPSAVGLQVTQSIESALIQQPNLDQIGQLSLSLPERLLSRPGKTIVPSVRTTVARDDSRPVRTI